MGHQRQRRPGRICPFQEQQVWNGAVTMPVSAHLEYRYARQAEAKGDHEAAEKHLMTALSLWPEYSDAHFALARIYLFQGNPDALYHMVQGIIVTATSFEGQRSLAVNAAVILVIVLILASAIAWMALAIRYFPFLVHRLAETLKIRFDASAPRVATDLLLLAPIALLPGYAAAAGVVMLATWSFMQRRERVFAFLTALMFAGIAFGAPIADRYTERSAMGAPNAIPANGGREKREDAFPALHERPRREHHDTGRRRVARRARDRREPRRIRRHARWAGGSNRILEVSAERARGRGSIKWRAPCHTIALLKRTEAETAAFEPPATGWPTKPSRDDDALRHLVERVRVSLEHIDARQRQWASDPSGHSESGVMRSFSATSWSPLAGLPGRSGIRGAPRPAS